MKILIVKPSSLGDVVQALPVLRLLKKHDPANQVYWWLAAELTPLLEGDPDLAGLFPFYRKGWRSPFYWLRLARTLRQIRKLSFDWVIDLQSLARSAAISWLARGSLTIGLDDPREGAEAFYDIAVPRQSYLTHAADWYLDVLRALKVPVDQNFTWFPPRHNIVADLRNKWAVENSRWIVVHPGARWTNKRWPIEYYAETVARLGQSEPEMRFAILGGGSDMDLGKIIAQSLPGRCLNLTGQTSLPEMIEWIRLADLMITNDTGPMHVAAAMKKPLIALFGPTEPHRTGPYHQLENALQHPLPCVPCMKPQCSNPQPLACLQNINPNTVVAAALQRLHPDASKDYVL